MFVRRLIEFEVLGLGENREARKVSNASCNASEIIHTPWSIELLQVELTGNDLRVDRV